MSSLSRFHRRISAGLALALCLYSSGCSFLAPKTQLIQITSAPDAKILIDGQEKGTGSVTLPLERDKEHSIRALRGKQQAWGNISKSISVLGWIDIVGGLLFGINFIGILAPGFWDLEPEQLHVSFPGDPPISENRK